MVLRLLDIITASSQIARVTGKTGLTTIGLHMLATPFVIFVLVCAMTMAIFYLLLLVLAGYLVVDRS